MKKQLLLTMTAILASLTISAQAVITTTAETQTFSVGNEATLPGYTLTSSSGTQSLGAGFVQIVPPAGVPGATQSQLSFNLQGTGDTSVNLSLLIRLYVGMIASVTITAGGGIPQTFALSNTSTFFTGTGTPNGYDSYTVPLSSTIVLANAVNTGVTIDVTGNIGTAAFNRTRIYSVTISKTTLTTNDFKLNSFQLYPNPTNNSFQINGNQNIQSVEVYNTVGQLAKTFGFSDSYNISDLSAGVYLAAVKSDSGSETIKVVKK